MNVNFRPGQSSSQSHAIRSILISILKRLLHFGPLLFLGPFVTFAPSTRVATHTDRIPDQFCF